MFSSFFGVWYDGKWNSTENIFHNLVHFGRKCFTNFKPVKRFANVKRRATNTPPPYLSTSTTIIIITKLTTTSTTTFAAAAAITTTTTIIIVTFITIVTTKHRKRNCFFQKIFFKKNVFDWKTFFAETNGAWVEMLYFVYNYMNSWLINLGSVVLKENYH